MNLNSLSYQLTDNKTHTPQNRDGSTFLRLPPMGSLKLNFAPLSPAPPTQERSQSRAPKLRGKALAKATTAPNPGSIAEAFQRQDRSLPIDPTALVNEWTITMDIKVTRKQTAPEHL